MLGVLDGSCPQIINTIILLGKIFILVAQSRFSLNIGLFKNILRRQFLLEKIIATNNCKVALHNMKWEKISMIEECDYIQL